MSVNSINDNYLSAIAQSQLLQQVSSTNSVTAAEDVSMQSGAATAVSKTDSYFSGIISSDEALPTGTYNSSGKYNDAALSGTSTDAAEANGADAVSSTDSGSGSDSSDTETKTTSEIVSINGISYLQTTTVENGVTTITRQQIS